MKKILTLLLAFTLSFSSCKDFLTIVPSDALFLEDVQALKQTLGGWLINYKNGGTYAYSGGPSPWITTTLNAKYSAYSDVFNFHNWKSKETLSESERRQIARLLTGSNEWAAHYAIIGHMNLILNEIDGAVGEDDMRNYVKGEALIHRAYCFFKILQAYAPMHDATMGIPVYTDTYGGFDAADLSRQHQRVVFDRILGDLLEAERLLGITPPRSSYNVVYNYDHIYRILAQVYLWKASGPVAENDDWANAARVAKAAIGLTDNALPRTPAQLRTTIFGAGSSTPSVPSNIYPEGLQCNATMAFSSFTYDYGYDLEVWKTLYKSNDLRKYLWFGITQGKDPATVLEAELLPARKRAGFGLLQYHAMTYHRLNEQYLILAEAYAHTDVEKGKEILRQWQSVRYSAPESDWYVPTSQEDLLEEIHRERKREFVNEGDLHWFDMKRLKVTGSARNMGEFTSFPLEADDFRYSFMIPNTETETNTGIKQNPRWIDYLTL